MPDDVIRLRSPFNGGLLLVPLDTPKDFVDELVKRGFVLEEDEPKPKMYRKETHAHG